MEKKYLLGIIVLVTLCLALFRFTSPAYSQSHGGDLVFGVSPDFATLNAATTPSGVYHVASGNIFNELIEHDKNGNPLPGLAKSWEVSSDGKTITFYLYTNVTWHDGYPFTSADVKFSLENVNGVFNSNAINNILPLIESIETPDNYTVIFRTKGPAPGFFDIYMGLGGPTACIAPKHLYEGTDILTNPYNLKPVGTGPYKFKEYVKGSYLILERNENYFKKDKPYIDRLIYRIIPDETTRANAWAKGEVNFLPMGVAPPALEELMRAARPSDVVAYYQSPFGNTMSFEFNLRREPFDDVSVRRAICMAIDKPQILSLVFFGGGAAGTSVISSPATTGNAEWFNSSARIPEFDPTGAEQLLDEAGYPIVGGVRFEISLTCSLAIAGNFKTAELIRDDLKDVGITVNINAVDDATYHQKVWKDWDFDVCLYSRTTNPPSLQRMRFGSFAITPVDWTNNMGYNNSRWDELDNLRLVELDKSKSIEYIKEQQAILCTDLPAFVVIEYKHLICRPGNLVAPVAQGDAMWTMLGRYMSADSLYFESEPAPEPTPLEPWIWVPVVAVVIVAGVAGAILLLRRRMKKT